MGTVAKGEGVHRLPVKKEFLEKIGVAKGEVVEVTMELDTEPRPIDVPDELKAILSRDRSLAKRFDAMSPSLRRAWAGYVGDAKRPKPERVAHRKHQTASVPGRFPISDHASTCISTETRHA